MADAIETLSPLNLHVGFPRRSCKRGAATEVPGACNVAREPRLRRRHARSRRREDSRLSQPRECVASFPASSSQSREQKTPRRPRHVFCLPQTRVMMDFIQSRKIEQEFRQSLTRCETVFDLRQEAALRVQPELPAGVTVNEILGRPACPQCGEMMFAAIATQFMGRGRISNSWSCEACDHEFETSVQMSLPDDN